MQSQRRNKKEKDNHYSQICEEVQGKRSQRFFVYVKLFAEPWTVSVPQRQGDNPVEQSKEDPNGEGTQEKVSEEDYFFAFHDPSIISDGRVGARLFGPTNLREFVILMDQLRECESAR